MARCNEGSLTTHPWKDGRTVTHGARVHFNGRYERVPFGTNLEGWNEQRAQIELERIMQQIERGTWIPPRLISREQRQQDRAADLALERDETFRTFADTWWDSKRRRGLDEDTINDYAWRLSYLHRFFDRMCLSEITVRQVDRFRDELLEQADVIRAAAARGRPIVETVTDRRGRTYQRRRRGLSNTSINAMLTLLGQILQRAVDYEQLDRNPVRVGGREERFLPAVAPARTFLEVDEFLALLDAAGELDRDARVDRRIGRRAMLATAGLAGFRISELCALRVREVDLSHCRFQTSMKTAAGAREPEMSLFLRDELVTYAADRRASGAQFEPDAFFFGSGAMSRRRDRHRINDRVLARSVALANEKRADAGLPSLPAVTPHSLRRTWATFAAQIGRDPKWIASQIGHTSPQFTFTVYAQVATRRFIEAEKIWALMRFADEPETFPGGRQVSRLEVTIKPTNRPTAEIGESASADWSETMDGFE